MNTDLRFNEFNKFQEPADTFSYHMETNGKKLEEFLYQTFQDIKNLKFENKKRHNSILH